MIDTIDWVNVSHNVRISWPNAAVLTFNNEV